MAKTGSTRGTVTIGEAGSVPLIESIIASVTPTITDQAKGQQVAAASAATTIDQAGVTRAVLVHLKFFDNDTNLPKRSALTVNSVVLPETTEFLYTTDDIAAGGITAIIFTPLSGNDTRCEYVLAGT